MAIKKTSKEEILTEAIKLFKIRGYYHTSMADIAQACGLIKGSIYHYFKSKDEIGLESLKYIHDYFQEHIYSIACTRASHLATPRICTWPPCASILGHLAH